MVRFFKKTFGNAFVMKHEGQLKLGVFIRNPSYDFCFIPLEIEVNTLGLSI